jgi:hypothetical protein
MHASLSCGSCDGPLEEIEPGTFQCTRAGCGIGRVTMGGGSASIKVGPGGSLHIGIDPAHAAKAADPDLPALRKVVDDAIAFLGGSFGARMDPANPACMLAFGALGATAVTMAHVASEDLKRISTIEALKYMRAALKS